MSVGQNIGTCEKFQAAGKKCRNLSTAQLQDQSIPQNDWKWYVCRYQKIQKLKLLK